MLRRAAIPMHQVLRAFTGLQSRAIVTKKPINEKRAYATAPPQGAMAYVKPAIMVAVVVLGGYFAYGFLFGSKSPSTVAHDARRKGEEVRDRMR